MAPYNADTNGGDAMEALSGHAAGKTCIRSLT